MQTLFRLPLVGRKLCRSNRSHAFFVRGLRAAHFLFARQKLNRKEVVKNEKGSIGSVGIMPVTGYGACVCFCGGG